MGLSPLARICGSPRSFSAAMIELCAFPRNELQISGERFGVMGMGKTVPLFSEFCREGWLAAGPGRTGFPQMSPVCKDLFI